ncbi:MULTISPECIES: YncE family protein [Actinomadura]|uniref:YncE family protein n=2 Tax=Actinomadura yumaensis TaxID=111807 RepID=A0ABW2CCF2_9ACTN|nr:YncE family protein [Actinomadura sp. J1-007]MWK38489.1 PQQ-binding-like beta-propeller repeat protein [Actinomadura sp. J1-007]
MHAAPTPAQARPAGTGPARGLRRLRTIAAAAVLAAGAAVPAVVSAGAAHAAPALQEVMFVGNNWDGTADVIRSSGDFRKIGRINVIPDKDQRLAAIYTNPLNLAVFLGIRLTAGEGHDQFVDDMYSTPDGTAMVASRPSFGDVVSIDLATGKVKWRFPVSGYRSDHMALSPDGTRVAVSSSLSNNVYVLDISTGRQLGSFATGAKPHENVFTPDGKIWNMSIGEVNNDLDAPWQDFLKGDRHITIADASTYKVVRTIDMRSRLDAFGRKDLSNAVRPAVFSPDFSKLYFQVSYFNGLVEYDVATDKITRVKTLPKNPATSDDRTTFVNDSRHHGLSMGPGGGKLCVAGTMDDYATVVDRATLQQGPLVNASKPYWATVSGDGKSCVISESGADQVTAISFATGQKTVSVPVGDHPQRVRVARIPADWTGPTD